MDMKAENTLLKNNNNNNSALVLRVSVFSSEVLESKYAGGDKLQIHTCNFERSRNSG